MRVWDACGQEERRKEGAHLLAIASQVCHEDVADGAVSRIRGDSDDGVRVTVELLLQGNDDALSRGLRLLANEARDLRDAREEERSRSQGKGVRGGGTFPMFVLSRAASISSKTKKGDGL